MAVIHEGDGVTVVEATDVFTANDPLRERLSIRSVRSTVIRVGYCCVQPTLYQHPVRYYSVRRLRRWIDNPVVYAAIPSSLKRGCMSSRSCW